MGVILDIKLSFTPNVLERVRMIYLQGSCRITLGNISQNCSWIYTAAESQILLYGVVVSSKGTGKQTISSLLTKAQRTACVSISGILRTTFIEVLEVLLHLQLIHAKYNWLRNRTLLG